MRLRCTWLSTPMLGTIVLFLSLLVLSPFLMFARPRTTQLHRSFRAGEQFQSGKKAPIRLHLIPEASAGDALMCPFSCPSNWNVSKTELAVRARIDFDQGMFMLAAGIRNASRDDEQSMAEHRDIPALPSDFRASLSIEAGFAAEWTILDGMSQRSLLAQSVKKQGHQHCWTTSMRAADLVILPTYFQAINLGALRWERAGQVLLNPKRSARVCADIMSQMVRRIVLQPQVWERWERLHGSDFVFVTSSGTGLMPYLAPMQYDKADGPKYRNMTWAHLASSDLEWREWALMHARWAWRTKDTCKHWLTHVLGIQNSIMVTISPSYGVKMAYRADKDIGIHGRILWNGDNVEIPPFDTRTVRMAFVGSVLDKRNEFSAYSQGIRQVGLRLYGHMTEETDGVVYVNGRVDDYMGLLRRSTFCLYLPGWYPNLWSHRLVDLLLTGCIPVVVQENVELPLREVVPWHTASVRVSYSFFKSGKLLPLLQSIPEARARELHSGVVNIAKYLSWNAESPSAFDVLETALAKRFVERGIGLLQEAADTT